MALIIDQPVKENQRLTLLIKIVIFEEDADESVYWLELMEESGLVSLKDTFPLKQEANELTAVFTAIGKTAKANQRNHKS